MGSSGGILFLQGLASWFFDRLGRALKARGHNVHRINFNGGDRVFWRLGGATDFRSPPGEWPGFFEQFIATNRIGQVVLFGDCRPPHRAAIDIARRHGLRVHVVEEGYLRPDWITFEDGGVNGYSTLPRDPAWYRSQAMRLPQWRDPPSVPGTFRRRAFEDVLYNFATIAKTRRFPYYTTHRPYPPLVEYAGWLHRLALMRRAERRAQAEIDALARSSEPVFLFPLQLDCDYQMRVHSPYHAVLLSIEHVLASFARHARPPSRLVVKLHPLDSGLHDWTVITRHVAVALGVAERLVILDGGSLDTVLARSCAVVTVNSTLGSLALLRGLPVVALGDAIYDMPGLTFQGGLDDFWTDAVPPDAALFDAFRRVLAARVLIPGSFFNETGLRLAVDAAIARLEAASARPAPRYAARTAALPLGAAAPIVAATPMH
ncbi:MAG TPA: capsular biosynthesis protein [Stellaceae bacterium]